MHHNVKALSPDTARAIFAYLARGGAVSVYATGARALPPSYTDANPTRPRFYCHHKPESVYRPGAAS